MNMRAGLSTAAAMNPEEKQQTRRRWCRSAGIGVAISGALVLLLSVWRDTSEPMLLFSPASAGGFVFLGTLIALEASTEPSQTGSEATMSRALGLVVTLWGVVAVLGHAPDTGPHGGIDTLSAVCFLLLGLALLSRHVVRVQRLGVSHLILIAVFAFAYWALLRQAFRVAIPALTVDARMSIAAAILFLIATSAAAFSRPEDGVLRILVNRETGAILTTRLIPLVLVLVPLIDLLQARLTPELGGAGGIAAIAVLNVALWLAFIVWTGNSLHRVHLEKRSVQSSIEENEERLRLALVSAGGAAWDWDLEHDSAWWSPEMYEMWQVEPTTPMHLGNSLDIIDERDREKVRYCVAKAIAQHSVYQAEFRLHGDEEERWMISRGRVQYDAKGRATRLTGITVDITERKRMELTLRQANAALERSNQELERFAHVASHDLQTPLRSIVSFAELLQAHYRQLLGTDGQTWLGHIIQSAQHLHALVHDLLQYARIDTQARPLQPVPLRSSFDHCKTLLQSRIEESGAEISCADLPVVLGDSSQLIQLWLNLLDNAIKYRSTEHLHIHVSARPTDEGWELSVRDNGIGIEPRHAERIFEMFERLHRPGDYPGTGVGLAICRRVVQRHGGRIWVESTPGQGSTFHFTLPRCRGQAT